MASVLDSYTPTEDANKSVYAGGYTKVGQSFASTSGKKLYSVRLKLKKTAGTTFSAGSVKVYAHSGTYGTSSVPTGSALATVSVDPTGISSASFAWYEFVFAGANQIELQDGYYVLTYENTTGDASNCIQIATKETSPTHGGNAFYYVSSNTAWATKDLLFEVYYELMGSPRASAHLRRMRQ